MARRNNVENPVPQVIDTAQLVNALMEATAARRPVQEDILIRFRKLRPPVFDGKMDPDKADQWLREMEKLYQIFECSETEKVILAVHTLQSEAEDWWECASRNWRNTEVPITWEMFRQAFREMFFSDTIKELKSDEFEKLRQGTKSVMEYQAKFASLAKYVPHVVANDDLRRRKFIKGLREVLETQVITMRSQNYTQAVEYALLMEEQETKRQRKRMQQQETTNGNEKKMKVQTAQPQQLEKKGNCPTCGKFHGNDPCRKITGACFVCGDMGHRMAQCPKYVGKAQRPKDQGRVFAIAGKDTETPYDTAGGMDSTK